MRRRQLTIIVALAVVVIVGLGTAQAIFAAPQTASARLQTGDVMGTVLAGRLNVRTGPGTTNAILGQLRQGDRVEVLKRQNGWLRITYPASTNGAAWVSGAYVSIDGETSPSSEVPAPSPVAGRGTIVFQTQNGGAIYRINGDGTGLRKLTSGFEPVLSPDGTQVAFTRFSVPAGLYLINADGSNERLVFGANRPRSPSWTPDGSAVVVEYSPRSVDCRWYRGRCLTEEDWNGISGGADCIGPEDNQTCYRHFPRVTINFTNLARVNLVGGDIRDLPASQTAVAPVHHPINDVVLYLDKEGLLVTQTEGNDPPQEVVNQPNLVGPAVFSPDGQLIYGMFRSEDHWDVWRWNADGSNPVALTSQPALSSKPINNVSPAVSPDGRDVIFLTDRNGKWEVYVMNADGSNQRPFAPRALAGISFKYDFNADRTLSWGK